MTSNIKNYKILLSKIFIDEDPSIKIEREERHFFQQIEENVYFFKNKKQHYKLLLEGTKGMPPLALTVLRKKIFEFTQDEFKINQFATYFWRLISKKNNGEDISHYIKPLFNILNIKQGYIKNFNQLLEELKIWL